MVLFDLRDQIAVMELENRRLGKCQWWNPNSSRYGLCHDARDRTIDDRFSPSCAQSAAKILACLPAMHGQIKSSRSTPRPVHSSNHNTNSHCTRSPEKRLRLVTMYVPYTAELRADANVHTGSSQRLIARRSTSTSSRRVYSWPRRTTTCPSTQTSTSRTSM